MDDMFLPTPYHVSFGDTTSSERTNIFRPSQPYRYIIPGVGMIIPRIVWIGYAIHLINKDKVPENEDCLFLDPDDGEFIQGILWDIFGHPELVIGRDWASIRPTEWLFAGKRSWPDNISSIVKSISDSKSFEIDRIKSDMLSVISIKFIRLFDETSNISFSNKIEKTLIPELAKTKNKELLARTIINFIRDCFLEIRDEYNGNLPNKFFESDIIDSNYRMLNFVESILGVENGKLGELEELGNIVSRYSKPIYTKNEQEIFFKYLNKTEDGCTLLTSFILIDYSSWILFKEKNTEYYNQIEAISDLKSDEILISCLNKILNYGETNFRNYLNSTKIFSKNNFNNINFEQIKTLIHFWKFNFLLYFGEIILRNFLDRNLLIEQGISENDINRVFKDDNFKIIFLNEYLNGNDSTFIRYLEKFKNQLHRIRATEDHMVEFINVLIVLSKSKNTSPPESFFKLLQTNHSFERVKSRLIPINDVKNKFNLVSETVVFPGREGIVTWLSELKEMGLR